MVSYSYRPPEMPENAARQDAGTAPQPGLGIPDWNSAQTIQKKGHHPIAAFTPGRHLRAGKVPAAQYQRLWTPEQLIGASERVLSAVLAVACAGKRLHLPR